jgi:hypothetical protein
LFVNDSDLEEVVDLDTYTKPDDYVWIRLAATISRRVGSVVLVTTDTPLRDAVSKAGWDKSFPMSAVNPEQALAAINS